MMVRMLNLAQIYRIGHITQSGRSNFSLCRGLNHFHASLHLRHLLLRSIDLLLITHRLPFFVTDIPGLPGAECDSLLHGHPACHLSVLPRLPDIARHCDGLWLLRIHSAECDMIPIAVQAIFLHGTAQCHTLQSTSDHIALVLT